MCVCVAVCTPRLCARHSLGSEPSCVFHHVQVRQSHKNPDIVRLYKQWLPKGPNSHEAHNYLHTHYKAGGGDADDE